MSSPEAVALPQKKTEETKDSGAEQWPPDPSLVCCETIRENAYHKWEATGRPSGDGVGFWLEAEKELKTAAGNGSAVDERS